MILYMACPLACLYNQRHDLVPQAREGIAIGPEVAEHVPTATVRSAVGPSVRAEPRIGRAVGSAVRGKVQTIQVSQLAVEMFAY